VYRENLRLSKAEPLVLTELLKALLCIASVFSTLSILLGKILPLMPKIWASEACTWYLTVYIKISSIGKARVLEQKSLPSMTCHASTNDRTYTNICKSSDSCCCLDFFFWNLSRLICKDWGHQCCCCCGSDRVDSELLEDSDEKDLLWVLCCGIDWGCSCHHNGLNRVDSELLEHSDEKNLL